MPPKNKGTVYIRHKQKDSSDKTKDKTEKKEPLEDEVIIYEIKSVFPFQLFPDKILIDKNKIIIIRNLLFFRRNFPILHEDIQTVRVNRGIIFAAMEFEVMGYERNPNPVTHLWPDQAIKAEQFILEFMQSGRNNEEISRVDVNKLKKKISEGNVEGENMEELV